MTRSSTPPPGEGRYRDMSPEEKLIAQWEAQHDVAARGSRCDPLGLQHQLSRERLADRTRPGARRPPEQATAAPPAREPVASTSADVPQAELPPAEPPPAKRHPWRRFRHHASEH
ncbi:hypothetical protein [Geodermatophilus sp. SYSU D00700]